MQKITNKIAKLLIDCHHSLTVRANISLNVFTFNDLKANLIHRRDNRVNCIHKNHWLVKQKI